MHFVYVKVPLRRSAGRTWDALHLALEQALAAGDLGTLLGWGASVPALGAREDDPASFHRIDIELRELQPGLGVLREALLKEALPPGTELHFTDQGTALQQSLSEGAWQAAVPSTGTHRPGAAKGAA